MDKLIDVLKRCETMLTAAKAPESDIKELEMLISIIESSSGTSPRSFYEYLYRFSEDNKPIRKEKSLRTYPKRTPTSIESIAWLYKELSKGAHLTKSDESILYEVNDVYPNLKDLLLGDITTLYDRISSIKDEEWTIEELQIILFYHFDIKPKQKVSRAMLLSELRKHIYNANYMESMKKKYEEKKDIGAAAAQKVVDKPNES